MRLILLAMVCAGGLAGCATPGPTDDAAARPAGKAACAPGEQWTVNDLLYFGTAKPAGGVVSPEEWAKFLRDVVTPRFPEGLTAWPASGQWRGNDGQVVREDSRVLQLLHPAEAAAERDVQAIAAEYKQQFAQDAVLRVRSSVCVSL
jgi:hypothetical protein